MDIYMEFCELGKLLKSSLCPYSEMVRQVEVVHVDEAGHVLHIQDEINSKGR